MISRFNVAFVLDRHPDTIGILAEFGAANGDVYCQVGDEKRKCTDVASEFDLMWPCKQKPWLLFHGEKRSAPVKLFDPFECTTASILSRTLSEVSSTYVWAILPWGREETMAMLAFVTTDEKLFNSFVDVVNHPKCQSTANSPLLLTTYKNIDADWNAPHGALFEGTYASEKLWDSVFKIESNPVIIHFERHGKNEDIDGRMSQFGEQIFRTPDEDGFDRVITRVRDRSNLAEYLNSWNIAAVVSENTNLVELQHLLGNIGLKLHNVGDYLGQLASMSDWVYFPENGYTTTDLYQTFYSKETELLSQWSSALGVESPSIFSIF